MFALGIVHGGKKNNNVINVEHSNTANRELVHLAIEALTSRDARVKSEALKLFRRKASELQHARIDDLPSGAAGHG